MDERSLKMDKLEEDSSLDKEYIDRNLPSEPMERLEPDFELENSDKRNLRKHNVLYTQLLRQYVSNFKEVSSMKKKYKRGFIEILLLLMIGIPIVSFVLVYYVFENFGGQENLPAIISGSLTAIVSLVTAFVSIPKIIVTYLFNEKEEENMTTIIKNIQDYDLKIRLNSSSQNEDDKDID